VSAYGFEADLRALGYACHVEGVDRLAVVTLLADATEPVPSELRKDALRLAPTHGFTHVALELSPPGPPSDAALSGD
jgi:hypothetical protein